MRYDNNKIVNMKKLSHTILMGLILIPILINGKNENQGGPVINISTTADTICFGDTLQFFGNAVGCSIDDWQWGGSQTVNFNPSVFSQNVSVTFSAPGQYQFNLLASGYCGNGWASKIITVLSKETYCKHKLKHG